MKQETLFDCGAPPRPGIYDRLVTEKLLDMLMPRVLRWLKDGGENVDSLPKNEFVEIRSQLKDVVDFNDDAYTIVKELDQSHYWQVDTELINIMEDVGFMRHKAHNTLVSEWVDRNGVCPKYSAGQRVTFKHHGVDQVGEVLTVEGKQAQYLVFCESLGHVRKGNGTHGFYLNFEDVKPELNTVSSAV